MRIQIKSDLHLEFRNYEIANDANDDMLILAGDIVPSVQLSHNRPSKFLKKCSELFKNVIYVAGNHEHYHNDIDKSFTTLKEKCESYGNIHFLNNECKIIDGIKFVGSTMWTSLNNDDDYAKYVAKRGMADFKIISNGGRVLLPGDTSIWHRESLQFIESECSTHDKVVVITHHAPSFGSLNPVYANDDLNHAFMTDLDQFILRNPAIKLWCHGHVHTAFDYMIGNTRIVCNPRGYVTNSYVEDTGWSPGKSMEVL